MPFKPLAGMVPCLLWTMETWDTHFFGNCLDGSGILPQPGKEERGRGIEEPDQDVGGFQSAAGGSCQTGPSLKIDFTSVPSISDKRLERPRDRAKATGCPLTKPTGNLGPIQTTKKPIKSFKQSIPGIHSLLPCSQPAI